MRCEVEEAGRGGVRWCEAGRGKAWQARQGEARRSKERRGEAKASRAEVTRGKAGRDEVRRDEARQAVARQGKAGRALVKLSSLPLLAGRNIDRDFVLPAVASSVDLVVHCARSADGSRHVAEVAAPTGQIDGGVPVTRTLYRATPTDPVPSRPLRRSERAA